MHNVAKFWCAVRGSSLSQQLSVSPMTKQSKILAITKRTADLCATQSLLYAAGFQLVTATSMPVARGIINGLRIKGVIVCACSWSEEERAQIATELSAMQPQITVVMHCPGCTGCDEARGCQGTLRDRMPILRLIETLGSATK